MRFPVASSIPPPLFILPSTYPQLVCPLCSPNPVTSLTVSCIVSPACPLIVLLYHKKNQDHLSVSAGIFHLLHLTLDLYIYIQIQTEMSVHTLLLFRPYFSLFPRSFWIWTKCCCTTINCMGNVEKKESERDC